MNGAYRTTLRVAATHPALPGHFPGNPIVPGVVLLERVAAAWQAWRGARVVKLDVKFLQPLRSGEEATLELRGDATRVAFAATRADGGVLARGVLEALP